MDRSCQYFDAFTQVAESDLLGDYYDPFTVRHRNKTTKMQLDKLEKTFETNTKPDTRLRRMLGDQLGMTPRRIQIWFQNRRAKEKKIAERRFRRDPSHCPLSSYLRLFCSSSNLYFSATNNSLFELPLPMSMHPACHHPQDLAAIGNVSDMSFEHNGCWHENQNRDFNVKLLDLGIEPCFGNGMSQCE